MQVEIIMRANVAGFSTDQVVKLEDGPLLKAILRGKHAEVLNPPDWEPDYESGYQRKAVGEDAPAEADSPKRTRKKSDEDSGESESTSS